ALHTYFRVDLMASHLLGLQDVRYNDSAAGGAPGREVAASIRVDGEVDRNYLQVTRPLELVDERTKLIISQQGFEDVVVWNPWRDKAGALRDLADDEYLQFLCIEAAQVNRAVNLPPGQRWTGQQRVVVAHA
ncbi:MAG: D-hexose-6-phosphate mutarotase, partial [Pseudomonadota bacterium]|nr:D-hexose-6-phosphate mutarotase [Pseudomonadota bacterium]